MFALQCNYPEAFTCYYYPTETWLSSRYLTSIIVQEPVLPYSVSGGFVGRKVRSTKVFRLGKLTKGPKLPQITHSHCMIRINETHSLITGGRIKVVVGVGLKGNVTKLPQYL